MSRIAIVDPALGRTGAHNLGFASLLPDRGAHARDLSVWCNTAIDEALRKSLAEPGVEVTPTFDTDFYAITNKPGGIAAHWDWIYALARQYIETFERIAAMGSTGRSTGVHLHYEVWVDGRPQNPARFLKAGDYLVQQDH